MVGGAARKSTLRPEVLAAFHSVPETRIAEILDGELFTQARPAPPHSRAGSRLNMTLGGPFDLGSGGPGGWVILYEPELWLGPGPDIVVPDLAGWRRERMPNPLSDGVTDAHYDLGPDWVCEIVSPSTEGVDRGKKRRIYRQAGVRHLWLLSPDSRTLEVYRLEDGAWREVETYGGEMKIRAEPFDAVELDLALVWGA